MAEAGSEHFSEGCVAQDIRYNFVGPDGDLVGYVEASQGESGIEVVSRILEGIDLSATQLDVDSVDVAVVPITATERAEFESLLLQTEL